MLAQLDAVIAETGVQSTGAAGQPVVSPYVSERRQQALALRALLGTLALPDVDADPVPHAQRIRSERARATAQARWNHP